MTQSAFSHDSPLTISCSHCGHKFIKSLRGIENNPRFPCASCGVTINATKMITKAIALNKGAREYMKKLGDEFRRRLGKHCK